MNPYFWLFSLCAVLAAPLRLHIRVRFGREMRYRIRLQMVGLPIVKKETEENDAAEETVDSARMAKGLFSLDRTLALSLLRQGHMTRLFKTFHLESVHIRALLSFENAALTAMSYAAARVAVQTALICMGRPAVINGRVEMDFHQKGTEVLVRCILSARLGSLFLSALRLLAAIIRTRAGLLKAKEDPYAASH